MCTAEGCGNLDLLETLIDTVLTSHSISHLWDSLTHSLNKLSAAFSEAAVQATLRQIFFQLAESSGRPAGPDAEVQSSWLGGYFLILGFHG